LTSHRARACIEPIFTGFSRDFRSVFFSTFNFQHFDAKPETVVTYGEKKQKYTFNTLRHKGVYMLNFVEQLLKKYHVANILFATRYGTLLNFVELLFQHLNQFVHKCL